MKKLIIIGIGFVILIWIIYTILGMQIPVHGSKYKVGSDRIYFMQSSRFIHCDIAYFEVIVHEDEDYEYVYELISVGNGSCMSELYIWDEFKYYNLSDAIENHIVSLDDFLKSDVVKKIPISMD